MSAVANLSSLSVSLNLTQGWALNLNSFLFKSIPDSNSFLSSGIWGNVPQAGGLNFSIISDPLPTQSNYTQVLEIKQVFF